MDEQAYRAAETAVWDHWGTTPIEHWVQYGTSGPRLRVQEVGDPGGPAILFIHGAAIAGTCWADLASRLQDHRCLLLDRPGCGLSEPLVPAPGLAGLAGLADELPAAVLDRLGIDRAHLVSNSLGGLFSLRTAAAHPDRVHTVTHVGWSLGSPLDGSLPLLMRLASNRVLTRGMARVPVNERAVRMMLRHTGLGEALDAGRIPDVGIAWNAAVQNHTDTRTHEYGLAGGAGLREQITALELPRELLARIQAPVRILFGSEDPFGTVTSMEALADAIPRGEVEVWQGAGHAVWLDDLDRAEKAVRDVLAIV